MNKLTTFIIAILVVFGLSWAGLVAYPITTLAHLQPLPDEDTGGSFPPTTSGLAVAGQKVYAANGCVHCHTQQVRLAPLSTDIAKNLGKRQSVARDYIRDHTPFFGSSRIGQDLTNYGVKETDANAIHRHLYEPRSVVEWSSMPSFRYLYDYRKIVSQPSAQAIQGLTGPNAPKPGFEVVPSPEAQALGAYLLSLKQNYPLPESPEPTAK